MNLDSHIMQALRTRRDGSRPVTINDLSRQFGVSPFTALAAARRLIDDGQAVGSTVSVHGVPTLHALRAASNAVTTPDPSHDSDS